MEILEDKYNRFYRNTNIDLANSYYTKAQVDSILASASAVSVLTDQAIVTPNASVAKNFNWSLTLDRTLTAPTNGTDGTGITIAALAFGASRVLTIDPSIKLTTGLSATVTIVSGKTHFLGLRYVAAKGWFLLASAQEL